MENKSLTGLIEKLKSSPRVKGIFTTGTTASQLNNASDIDLVVLLGKNNENIKSIYTIIENRFSDIFFFDIDFVNQLRNKQEISANNFDGMFIEWLVNGKIEYDPDGILNTFKNEIVQNSPSQNVTESEKRDFWIKINYNFIANTRYYKSNNDLYHKALEFRLLYSVIELVTAYFSFRDIPWRGEKTAVKYFERNDPKFFSTFQKYLQSRNLNEKMRYYKDLFAKTFFDKYQKWEDNFVVPISWKNNYDEKLLNFWDDLLK